jgi:GAF domain-containing protein
VIHSEAEVVLDEAGAPFRMVGTAQDITERKRAEMSARARLEQLKIVGNIAKAAGSTLEPDELFKTIIQEIRRAVSCERCVIGSIDKSKRLRTILHSESDIKVESGDEYHPYDFLSREVYEPKKAKLVPDAREIKDKWFSVRQNEGFKSFLFIPILQDERCIAHVGLASTRINAFSEEHKNLLTLVASHLGSAIRNASLFHAAEERASRFSALNDLSQQIAQNLELEEVLRNIARVSVKLTRGDKSRIFLYDGG